MCDFCKKIPVIKELETLEDELKCEDKSLTREKIVLVRYKDKIKFYGFNKYFYEDDALYENVNVKFCPLCGRKFSEETEKPNTDEIIAKLKENLTEDEQKKLDESIKSFADGLNGLWEVAGKEIEMDNCYINLGAVKAKEIDGELYVSCWNFSKALAEKEQEISDLCKENDELEKKISELEAQIERDKELLEVKTAEVSISEGKILSCLCPYCGKIVAGKIPNGYEVDEEPLPFSSDEYEECLEEELEDLRERNQQDCITINQLQATIDTLIDRYAKLREMRGL